MHITGIFEWRQFPKKDVLVDKFFSEIGCEGADLEAIKEYKKLFKNKKEVEPIWICGDVLVDGTHRIIAAHELGLKTIKAYVCDEEK